MYNVGDRVQFINLKGSSWEKSCATVEKIDENLFWFRRDDGERGNLMRASLPHYTRMLAPFSLENK